MAIDEIIIPENTIVFGWNLGEKEIEVETLNTIVNIYYVSRSTKAYECVEIDTVKKTVTTVEMEERSGKASSFSPKPPKDFAAVIQATSSEITARGSYNKYYKAFGKQRYMKITEVLNLALGIAVQDEKNKEDKISFNPSSNLKLGAGSLSRDGKSYFTQLKAKEMPTVNGTVIIERDLSINLRTDGYLDLILTHKLNGAVRWKSEAVVPNYEKAVTNLLNNYYESEVHTIAGWVLNV